eukprot:477038_1
MTAYDVADHKAVDSNSDDAHGEPFAEESLLCVVDILEILSDLFELLAGVLGGHWSLLLLLNVGEDRKGGCGDLGNDLSLDESWGGFLGDRRFGIFGDDGALVDDE